MKLSAWFLLWVLLLPQVSLTPSRGSFQTIVGTASNFIRAKGTLLRRPRQLRDLRNCTTEDLERDQTKCCSSCPAGYHKKGNCIGSLYQCSPCPDGTYTAISNHRNKCFSCKMCDEKVSMVIETECTRTSDVKCRCKEGYIQRQTSTPLSCMLDKREPLTPTGEVTRNTTTAGSNPVVTLYNTPHTLFLPMSLGSMAIMVLGALIVQAFWFWTRLRGSPCCWCLELYRKPPKPMYTAVTVTPEAPNSTSCSPAEMSCARNSDPIPTVSGSGETSQQAKNQEASEMSTLPPRPQHTQQSRLIDAAHVKSAHLKMQRLDSQSEHFPPPVLYAIIQEVPVRRWKEFLRLLHVPDGQMERVEFEAGPTYLERQYQMLRLWSQRGGSELVQVYAALASMELSGCAQELRDKLEQLEKVDPCAQMLNTKSDRPASG